MVHPLGPIFVDSLPLFDRYLTNECFNVVFQCVKLSGHVFIDMSFNKVNFLREKIGYHLRVALTIPSYVYSIFEGIRPVLLPAYKPHQNVTVSGCIDSLCNDSG